jgi:hypothetical protein
MSINKPVYINPTQGLSLPTYVTGQYLTNNGTTLSWAANGMGDLLANGTVPLTANWPMGAFTLSQATWQGVAITPTYGGIGAQTPFAIGDILYADSTTTFAKRSAVATGQVLASAGVGVASAFTASPTLTGDLTASNLIAAPTLSNEALTNVAGWTAAGSWTYAAGTIWSHSTGNATALTATGETAIVAGTKYEIVMVLTTSTAGGGLAVSLGGQGFAAVSATGSYTFNVTAASTAALAITPTSGTWVGSLTISVKLVTNGQLNAEGIVLNSGSILAPDGNISYPSYGFNRYPNAGMTISAANLITSTNVTLQGPGGGVGIYLGSSQRVRIPNLYIGADYNLPIVQNAAAELQLGVDAVSPIDQTLKSHDASGNNGSGAMLTLQGGQNKGSGAGGGVRIQTANTNSDAATAGVEYTRYRAVGVIKTLTDGSATDVCSFAVVAGAGVGGMLTYTISVVDNDASDMQIESGTVIFAGLQDEANWHTSISEVSTQALESGSLATTWAIDTATANTLKITCLADSDLTTPVITLRYQLHLNSPIVETVL